jgi:hypothetical protein
MRLEPEKERHPITLKVIEVHQRRNDGYPDKMERYQAEALAHRHVPPAALLGIGCVSDRVRSAIEQAVQISGAAVQVFSRPGWYF